MARVTGISTLMREMLKEGHYGSTHQMSLSWGIPEPTIWRWLAGHRRPSGDSCRRLAAATGTPLEEVVLMATQGVETTDTSEQESRSLSGIPGVVEELRRKQGSINAAARAIGMPQATLHNLARGAEPTFGSLRLMARAMKVPLWQLVRRIEEEETGNE